MVIFHSYVSLPEGIWNFARESLVFPDLFHRSGGSDPEDVHRRLVHPFGAHWDGPLPDLLLPGAEKKTEGRGDR